VEAADEDDQIVNDAIQKAVRKPANEGSAGVSMDDRVAVREGHDRVHHSARFAQEFVAESASLSLIPAVDYLQIGSRRGSEYVPRHRARALICATTSSHGMPTGPSCSRSSKRRSSSPRWPDESGSACGSRPRLSQRRSRRSSRSSSLRRLTSTAGLPITAILPRSTRPDQSTVLASTDVRLSGQLCINPQSPAALNFRQAGVNSLLGPRLRSDCEQSQRLCIQDPPGGKTTAAPRGLCNVRRASVTAATVAAYSAFNARRENRQGFESGAASSATSAQAASRSNPPSGVTAPSAPIPVIASA